MTTRSRLAETLWPRDGRPTEEIDASIREELEAHVERLVEEQVRAGVPADEARRQALARFGDVDRYAAQCRRIDLGDRLLVRRALVAACLALVATSIYLGWRARHAELVAAQLRRDLANAAAPALRVADKAEDSHTAWVERLVALRDHMHTAFAVGPELTLLDPNEGLAIVREAWPRITIAEVKTGLLKAFAFGKALAPQKHPRLVQVLHLGMTDDDPEIRRYAASYLEEIAREDLSEDPARYLTWYDKYGEMPVDEVLRQTQLEVPASLRRNLVEMETEIRAGDIEAATSIARRIGESGHPYAIPALIGLIDADNSYDTVYGVGYFALGDMTNVDYSPYHDGAWWRRWWAAHKSAYAKEIQDLPIPDFPKSAHGADYEPLPADLDTLDGKLRHYAEGRVGNRVDIWSWATEVAKHKDPAAIPFLIGAIDADNTYETIYGVGAFALDELTGVRYEQKHDGAWWRAWWEKHKGQYAHEVQAIEIPDLRGALGDKS